MNARADITLKEQKADDYLDVARSLALNKRIDESLYYYKECLHILEELGFKSQLNRLIWEIEKILTGDIKSLQYLQYDAFQDYDHVRKELILERIQQYEDSKTWLEKKEELLDHTLTDAKKYADAGKISKAKIFYRYAAKILKQIGWTKELNLILDEIKLLDEKIYIAEERKRIEKELSNHKKREMEQFLEEEKRKFEQRQQKTNHTPSLVSPEQERINKKLQIAELNLKKAQDAEKAANYQLALNRYKYLLSIYVEINYDPIKCERIKQKIREIQDKVNLK
ncbi:MAG: hypothetical protein JW776_10520 [Candidatus Lokiarchaeota archaeon]|nr:hypothetical protein [Candidatus Lokiarchaeota archaeon]